MSKWITLSVFLAGCVVDIEPERHSRPCGEPACTYECQYDDECPGNFACYPYGSYVDPEGCVERCYYDYECKAGSICLSNGDCVECDNGWTCDS